MRKINEKALYRTLDANFNRAKEGLRVCEDIARFVLNNQSVTKKFRGLRHRLTEIILSLKIKELIQARDVPKDVGKKSIVSEFKRKNVGDIFYANCQRVKESIRVLEEFTKLINKSSAQGLKEIRYKLYALEKGTAAKF